MLIWKSCLLELPYSIKHFIHLKATKFSIFTNLNVLVWIFEYKPLVSTFFLRLINSEWNLFSWRLHKLFRLAARQLFEPFEPEITLKRVWSQLALMSFNLHQLHLLDSKLALYTRTSSDRCGFSRKNNEQYDIYINVWGTTHPRSSFKKGGSYFTERNYGI